MKKAFDDNLPRMKPHLRLQTHPSEAPPPLLTDLDLEHLHAGPAVDVKHGAAEALLSAAEGLAGELAEARGRSAWMERELMRAREDLDRALAEVTRLVRLVGRAGIPSPGPLVETAREHPDDRVRAAAVVACLRFGTRAERAALFRDDSLPPAKLLKSVES
jgi:hypothetical protein